MLETRKALENYETLKGTTSCSEHIRLMQAFNKATKTYLQLSKNQR